MPSLAARLLACALLPPLLLCVVVQRRQLRTSEALLSPPSPPHRVHHPLGVRPLLQYAHKAAHAHVLPLPQVPGLGVDHLFWGAYVWGKGEGMG